LSYLQVNIGTKQQRWPLWVLAVGLVLSFISLTGPTWTQLPQTVFEKQQAQVLVLDLSRSMWTDDVRPSRLVQARFKLLEWLKQRQEGQTALIAFAGEAHLVAPLTSDTQTLAALVPQLDPSIMPKQGSAVHTAIDMATQLLKQGGATTGDIILFMDAEGGTLAEEISRQALTDGYHIHILGIGTTKGAPIPLPNGGFIKDAQGNIVVTKLNEISLQNLAHLGGGQYIRITPTLHDIEQLSRGLERSDEIIETSKEDKQQAWIEEGPWLLLLLLPIAALAFRRGYC
jgi:Ca-activated chloride channel family protein